HLFVTARPDLDDPLIVPFTCLCDPEYVLPRRNVPQHHSARGADASLSLVVDIDLGSLRGHYHELRVTRPVASVGAFGSRFEVLDPVRNGRMPFPGLDGKRPHYRCFEP